MGAYQQRTSSIVGEMMAEYGETTRQALLRFLPNREPRRYLYDLIGEYPRRRGRYMRPAICLASARAHGASVQQALNCAVSVELLHNALLVVDDIQDGSEERRGKPTLHKTHGIPMALNVGSTMSILSLVPLLRNVEVAGPHVALWIFERAIEVAQHCAEGQAMELGWRQENRMDVTEAQYFDMVLRKTCAYSTMFPMRVGAMIGWQRRSVADALLRYGYFVGAAFQIQDDLLNLEGDHQRYGKELYGDLLEGKRTLMIIALLERCSTRERRVVESFLAMPRDDKTSEDVESLLSLLRRYACMKRARHMAQGLVGAAQHEFERGLGRLPPSRDKDFLQGLSTWVIEQV